MSDRTTRRDFIETLGVIGAAGAVGAVAASCGPGQEVIYPDYGYPPLLDQAPDGPVLKAGLIGCGGRGTGAIQQFLDAGPNLEVIALAARACENVGLDAFRIELSEITLVRSVLEAVPEDARARAVSQREEP